MRNPIAIGIAAIIGIVFLTIIFGSWYTIDQTERGVILRNGAITGEAEPGLHFKMPIIDSVVKITAQQHVSRWICTDAARCDPGDGMVMQAYSQDQQPADLRVSVNWHVPPDRAKEVYSTYSSVDNLANRVIFRKVPQEVKTVFGQFNAVSVIQERARFNQEVANAVSKAVDGPVNIDSVQVENIDFSDAYELSVEQRMMAQVEVQKREQELRTKQIEAQITVTTAQGQADSNLAIAKANAEATRITGQATADAIKARAAALAGNPLLVQLTTAERWDGRLPATMIPGASIPMVSIPTQ